MAAQQNGQVQMPEVYEGVKISEFATNTRTIHVEWLDKMLRVEYRPGALNDEHFALLDADIEAGRAAARAEFQRAIAASEKGEEEPPPAPQAKPRDWMVGYFLRVVHSIPSITMDDGSPFLITEETIKLLPMPLKNRIVDAIGKDLDPKATSPGSGLNSSSSPAVSGG